MIDRSTRPVAPGEPNGAVAGYLHGLAVKTGLQLPSAGVSPNMANQFGENYLLTLPQRTMAGGCTWSAPVRFLVDFRDVCDIEVTSESCVAGLQLDALMYMPSPGWGVAMGPLVLYEQSVGNVTKTDVNFLCVETPESYVKSARTDTQSVPRDIELCFATNNTCSVIGDCDFDPTTSAYRCPNDSVSWLNMPSTPARCSFDNGFTVPQAPSFDTATGVCSNAVVAVEYNFTWSGQTITHLNATVILADLATQFSTAADAANMTVLSQHFDVSFVSITSQAAVDNRSSSHSNMYYPPSGNPGKSSLTTELTSL